MPSPSQAVGFPPAVENGKSLQANALEVVANTDKIDQQSGCGTSGKVFDTLEENTMTMVLVNKNKVVVESVKDSTETKNEFSKQEQEDPLALLIKSWSIPPGSSLQRRGSCEFTTCISPCVKKAVSHLQQLYEQLTCVSGNEEDPEELAQRSGLSSGSSNRRRRQRDSSSSSRSSAKPSPWDENVDSSSVVSSPISDLTSVFSYSQETSVSKFTSSQVYGSKTATPPTKASASIPTKAESTVNHLGSAVMDEVIRLLGRLERDRLATHQMLVQEKKKVRMLRHQIDKLAFKRLIELPAAVQGEHESCTTDINELKWHCSYRGRLEARTRRRVQYAESQYAKFIEDVQAAKQSCPLVKEKLDLEALAMESIQSKQDETDEELRQTLKRLEATQQKTNAAKRRAEQERKLVKQDVDIFRNLLNEVSDHLARLRMNYTAHVHTISDIKNTLKENAAQCHNLEQREEKVKSQEASQQDKVLKLREKIAEQQSEHLRLSEENEKLKKDNLVTEGDFQAAIAKLMKETKQYEVQIREMTRKNKAMREDMDNTTKRIEKCKKQRKSDKKSLIRAGQEVDKIKEQNEMMGDEAKRLKTLNHSLKTTKMQQEEEYFDEEDSLKNAESSLRNQLKEESHIRTVLQARIAADTSDLLRSRVDSKKKKEKLSKQAADAEKVVSRIKEQVCRLELVHNERKQTISQMNETLNKLSSQREEMESKYRAKIAELRPKEELTKKEQSELEQKIDQIKWRSDMMSNKMEDMSSSTVMMTRVINSTQEDIAELEEDCKEAKLRLESSIDTEESLRQAIEETRERGIFRRGEHEEHWQSRTLVLEESTKSLQEKLEDNKTLAEEYQRLHSTFLQAKDRFFKNYETSVNEQSHLKDHKELHSLQGRMRECLQYYYDLRGLQNKSQVAQFRLHNKENNDKLCELQQELSNVVTNINNFLESNNDSHKTISMEAAAMARTPAVR